MKMFKFPGEISFFKYSQNKENYFVDMNLHVKIHISIEMTLRKSHFIITSAITPDVYTLTGFSFLLQFL